MRSTGGTLRHNLLLYMIFGVGHSRQTCLSSRLIGRHTETNPACSYHLRVGHQSKPCFLMGGTLKQILPAHETYRWDTKANPAFLYDLLDGTLESILFNHRTYGWDFRENPASSYDLLGWALKQILSAHKTYGWDTKADPACD